LHCTSALHTQHLHLATILNNTYFKYVPLAGPHTTHLWQPAATIIWNTHPLQARTTRVPTTDSLQLTYSNGAPEELVGIELLSWSRTLLKSRMAAANVKKLTQPPENANMISFWWDARLVVMSR